MGYMRRRRRKKRKIVKDESREGAIDVKQNIHHTIAPDDDCVERTCRRNTFHSNRKKKSNNKGVRDEGWT